MSATAEVIAPWELHDHARHGDIAAVRELLDAGVTVDYMYGLYGTALHEAVAAWSGKDHTEIVTLLIDRDADVNGVGYDGMTPLHWAVCQNSPEIATLLLDRGADVNAKDDEGWTPIHQISMKGRIEFVALLASRGATFTADEKEALELHLAKAATKVKTIRTALKKH